MGRRGTVKEKVMNRRIGHAEREGLAVIRRERAKAIKQEAIGVSIAGGIAVAFFWICYCIWANGMIGG